MFCVSIEFQQSRQLLCVDMKVVSMFVVISFSMFVGRIFVSMIGIVVSVIFGLVGCFFGRKIVVRLVLLVMQVSVQMLRKFGIRNFIRKFIEERWQRCFIFFGFFNDRVLVIVVCQMVQEMRLVVNVIYRMQCILKMLLLKGLKFVVLCIVLIV